MLVWAGEKSGGIRVNFLTTVCSRFSSSNRKARLSMGARRVEFGAVCGIHMFDVLITDSIEHYARNSIITIYLDVLPPIETNLTFDLL